MSAETIHATALAAAGKGILILGPSGSGKSALALDLIDQCRLRGLEAVLVSDDRTIVTLADGIARASTAPGLEGLIEVRGSGVHEIAWTAQAPLSFGVRLVSAPEAVRMPDGRAELVADGIRLPCLRLCARDPRNAAIVLAHIGHYGGVSAAI